MPGAISTIGHDGSLSENIAALIFSLWGTVVSTPIPQDYGIDLHCTITETVGKREWAKSPYTVQVKSNLSPWIFDDMESVRWLIEHPLPLFLCVVDRAKVLVRVYHTAPRFYVWSQGLLPERMTLKPTLETKGRYLDWTETHDYSLGAPILEVSLGCIGDEDVRKNAKKIMETWIERENENLTFIRAGLTRFRMPGKWETNDPSITKSYYEHWNNLPSPDQHRRAVTHLSACLNSIGVQFDFQGDRLGAIEAGLIYRHLRKQFPDLFLESDSDGAFSGVFYRLTEAIPGVAKSSIYSGIDEIERHVIAALSGTDAERKSETDH